LEDTLAVQKEIEKLRAISAPPNSRSGEALAVGDALVELEKDIADKLTKDGSESESAPARWGSILQSQGDLNGKLNVCSPPWA
jgi:hypothetical protein